MPIHKPKTPSLSRALLGFVLVPCLASISRSQEPGAVDFARQILPILSDKCFVCHGPDTAGADRVRLDSREGATRDLGGYRAIDPSNLKASRLVARIHDAVDPMPPRDSGKALTPRERELLSRWVAQGGEYAPHWSFVAPRKVAPPPTEELSNPIDRFIAQRLDGRGVGFAREADRRTLARRAALTLTGLPPDLDVLEAFLADEGAGAYERLVDGLLDDPRYGEHQARYWLDAVRYGDTHGLHLDNRRGIHPYRDWVVRAFNDNLPIDDFITWQLAGDLLPEPTLAQRVATGFVRMNPTTAEGGAIPAEFQAKNNFDRTESFGTVMLGMTMTCARCHTHKYDPITHVEYYRLLAFFNSTAESPMDGNRYAYAPVIAAPDDQADWEAWESIEAGMRALAAEADGARALSYAKDAVAWASSSWAMSGVVEAKGDRPAPEAFAAVKGLPGAKRDVRVGANEALWCTSTVTTKIDQTLRLTVAGAAGTEAWLDDAPLPSVKRDGRSATFEIPLPAGAHGLRIKMLGAKKPISVDVRCETAWKPLAEGRPWAEHTREERLRLIADQRGAFAGSSLQRRAAALVRDLDTLRKGFTTTLVARDLGKPRVTRVLQRGEYNLPTGDALTPATPSVLGGLPKDAPANRLGLARWLTSRRNPLVARVFINRVWQRVFGVGLVRTPEDFGLQGQQPTHPALLDWLAVELQDSGWDMKRMIRSMVTSRTFRQRSVERPDLDDPENRLFARGPRHRLDAEVIRDMALFVSASLDPHMGGAGVKPYQPPGLWAALAHPASNTKKYVQDKGEKLRRRSLYVYWKRTSPHPMMTLFDAPSRESSCVRRSRTNTPLQSLALLNERQRIDIAVAFARRLLLEADDDARFELLFKTLASRPPSARESAACAKLLARMRTRYAGANEAARALVVRPYAFSARDVAVPSAATAGRSEDLEPGDLAELAAWSQVAITVLASDVALMLY